MVEEPADKVLNKPVYRLPPFDMGIRKFKQLVAQNTSLSKSDKNRATRAYKERVYSEVDEIKRKINESKQGTSQQ